MNDFFRPFLILFFLLGVTVYPLQSQNILFVGGDEYEDLDNADRFIIDSLTAWGFDVNYITDTRFDTSSSDIYIDQEGIFFSQSAFARSIKNFGPARDNFPLPCITLDPFVFGYQYWDMFGPDGSLVIHEPADSTDLQLRIEDTSHYITRYYDKEQVLTLSDKTESVQVQAYFHGFNYNVDVLARPVAEVENPNAIYMGVINDPEVPNDIFFCSYYTYNFQNHETEDFSDILNRAANFIYRYPYEKKKDILFVGGGSFPESVQSDSMLVDSLQSWGYNVHYMDDDGFDASSNEVYQGMDAVFFNESVGATYIRNFGPYRDNFPLPCVILDAGALENHSNRWSMFAEGGGVLTNDTPVSSDFYMQIKNNQHYITENYNEDTVIQWSYTADFGVVPFVQGLKYDMEPLSIPVTQLGYPNAFTMGALDDENFPNRMFYFGITKVFIHDGNQIEATPDFFHLMKRGTEWVLGDTISAGCEASFSSHHLTDINVPGSASFQFNDSSDANTAIVDWQWQFGDGEISYSQHPLKNYRFYKNSPDSFLVTLTIETAKHCKDDTSQYISIGHLRPDCDADFDYQIDTGKYHNYIQFTNSSESDSVVHAYWDFGNGAFVDTINPYQYVPLIPGDSVEVSLAIETISGCEDTTSQIITHMIDTSEINIMLIGNGYTPMDNHFDKAVYDSLKSTGYTISFVNDSVFDKKMNDLFYSNFDGVFISSTANEKYLKRFAMDNYPLPAINFNIHVLKYEYWAWIVSEGLQMSSTPTGSAENSYLTIKSKSHYITGLLKEDEVKWSSVDEYSDISENIGYAIAEGNINYSAKLATTKGLDGNEMWSMVTIDSTNELSGLPNKMVIWGVSTAGLQGKNNDNNYTTPDFWYVLKRAFDWTYHDVQFTPPTNINELAENQEKGLLIYPNPASSEIQISVPTNRLAKGIITINDFSGRLMDHNSFELSGKEPLFMNVSNYPNGFYYLRIQIEDETFHDKLLIRK